MEIKQIKYLGEQAVSYLIEKCKATFALITHTHTPEEIGADTAGSASAALALAEEYADEKIDELENVYAPIEHEHDMAVKPFPIYEIYEQSSTIKIARVNLFELDTQQVYTVKPQDSIASWQLRVYCDDGTNKSVCILGYGSIYRPMIGNSRSYLYSENEGKYYAINHEDLSTSSNVTVTTTGAYRYISIGNTTEYTPKSDYHPATKKYVDDSVETVNTTLSSLTDGSTPVAEATHSSTSDEATHAVTSDEATHATSADSATNAEHAESATSAETAETANEANHAANADMATSDGEGNVIAETYETKEDAKTKLAEAKDYVDNSIAAIPSDVFVVTVTGDNTNGYTADKTYEEIKEVFINGQLPVVVYDSYVYMLIDSYDTYSFRVNLGNKWHTIHFYSDGRIVGMTTSVQDLTCNSLTTTSKTIAGAINELNAEIDTKASQDDVTALEELVGETAVSEQINTAIAAIPSNVFVVTITGNVNDGFTADKTATEIYEAYSSGKYVYAIDGNNGLHHLTQCQSSFANFESYSTSINSSYLFLVTNSTVVKMSKANYTKTEVDNLLSNKADASTVESTYETKEASSAKLTEAKAYTDTAVANLVNSAPETLDTLGELATALQENESVVEALNSAISTKADAVHVHEITDINGLQDNLSTINESLANKSDSDHNHDTVYYTQDQINEMEFITTDEIDEICGAVTEGSMLESDVDELIAELEE